MSEPAAWAGIRRQAAGFTLLEVMLSVAIITLMIGLSLPLYQGFQSRNDLDLTTQSVAEALRRAEAYARAGKGDAPWGLKLSSGSAVVFEGTSYAARDTTADETMAIAGPISSSGLNEVVFAKQTGYPAAAGTITLASTNTTDTRTITLNAKGMVSY